MSARKAQDAKLKRKAIAWRRDPVILARLAQVEPLYIAGRSHVAIAVALGVTEATVRNDVRRLSELWLERIGEQSEVLRAEAVAELEDVRRRALAAAEFDRQAEAAVLFGLTYQQPDGTIATVYRDRKDAAQFRGNKAQALNVARQAVMDKAKLLGLVVDRLDHTLPVPVARVVMVEDRRPASGAGAVLSAPSEPIPPGNGGLSSSTRP